MNPMEILNGPFDIETHKENFTNYLEVVIRPDGVVEYAVPSHMEKLMKVACDKLGISRAEFIEGYCREHCIWGVTDLCKLTGYVSVWDHFYEGYPNEQQLKTLDELTDAGLFSLRTTEDLLYGW